MHSLSLEKTHVALPYPDVGPGSVEKLEKAFQATISSPLVRLSWLQHAQEEQPILVNCSQDTGHMTLGGMPVT